MMATLNNSAGGISEREQVVIRARLASLGEWFHNIDLKGVPTAPNHFLGDFPSLKWPKLAAALPQDLSGKTVLDVGCNGGFYSLQMKNLGASRVLGIDFDADYLAQARFAAEVYEADIEFREMSVYDVSQLKEKFDIVLFMGVLYHLRHPLLALDLLAEHVVKDSLVFQSLLRGSAGIPKVENDYPFAETEIFEDPDFPVLHFIEHSYSHDQTNWWIPNRACALAMLRSAGFRVAAQPDEDVFLCHLLENNGRKIF